MNARIVVNVELRSGDQRCLRELSTEVIASMPRSRLDRTESVTTIALSTKSPSATMSPVTDI